MFKNIVVAMSANTAPLRAGLATASRDVHGFDTQLKATNATSGKLGKSLMALGAVAVIGLATVLGSAASKAIEFDREMRNVNSIMQLSHDEFSAVSDEVLAISTRVPQAAGVLAEGLYNIASAGFDGAEGLEVLEQSAVAAAAGMTTTDVSAKAITSVLNAYGREASDAADVSDTLFKAVEVGVLTFEGLSSSLGDVIGLASAAGVEIDEVAAAMSAMTLAGMNEAQSSTSLSRVIQAIIDPSEELNAQLARLGHTSGQAALDSLGLHGVMEQLRTTTDGSVESWMELFPEIRAARGAFALTAAEGQNYAMTAEQIIDANNRAGSTQAAYTEQLKSVSLQWDLLMSSFNAGMITLGTRLLPVLTSVIAGMGSMLDSFTDVASVVATRLAPAWEAITDIGGSLMSIIGSIATVAGGLVGALAMLASTAVVPVLTAILQALAGIVGWVADNEAAMIGLATALAVYLMPPLTALITRLQVMMVMGLVNVIGGMSAAAHRAAAAFRSLSLATVGIGALAMAIAAVAFNARGLREDAREMARELADSFGAHIDTSNMEGAVERARAQVDGLMDELSGRDREDQNYFQWVGSNLWDAIPGLESGVLRANAEYDALAESAEDAQERLANSMTMTNNVWRELDSSGIEITREEIHQLADALGIDLTTAGQDAIPIMVDAATAARDGAPEFAELGLEIEAVASAQQRATQELKEYMEELQAAFDPLFAAQKASKDLAQAQEEEAAAWRDAAAAAKEHGEGSDEAAEAMARAEDASWAVLESILKNESALHDLKAGLDDGTVSMEAAKEMTDRWKQSEDMLSESQQILLRDIEKLIAEAEEWGSTNVSAELNADTRQAEDDVRRLSQAADRAARNRTFKITGQSSITGQGAQWMADGGILKFANGTENHVAQIASAGDMRVWAEPETGGEAYIPLSPAKRDRSEAILTEVAQRFGHRLVPMADGGTLGGRGSTGGGSGRSTTLNFEEGSVIVSARDERSVAKDIIHELRWVGTGMGGGS